MTRNEEIFWLIFFGARPSKVGKAFGVTTERARQIFRSVSTMAARNAMRPEIDRAIEEAHRRYEREQDALLEDARGEQLEAAMQDAQLRREWEYEWRQQVYAEGDL